MSYHVGGWRRGLGAVAPWDGAPIAGATMTVSQETLDSILAATGGSVIQRSWGQTDIVLPSGQIVNAGALASVYANPVFAGNQKVADGEASKILNSDACITEWGNVVDNCHTQLGGAYTVSGGAVSYTPGVQPVQVQAPVLSQSQYSAFQAKVAAAASAAAPAPAPAPAPAAAASPLLGGGSVGSTFDSLLTQAKALPMWVWLAAAAGGVFLMQGGGRGR